MKLRIPREISRNKIVYGNDLWEPLRTARGNRSRKWIRPSEMMMRLPRIKARYRSEPRGRRFPGRAEFTATFGGLILRMPLERSAAEHPRIFRTLIIDMARTENLR